MKTILFIHGMFQNEKSWKQWTGYFTARGYNCIAPSWPDHGGEPAELRNNPPATLGQLRLETVQRYFEDIISGLDERPVAIGHSVGGLLVQKLSALNLLSAGIAICSVAPNRMLSVDWNFFKNATNIANPLKGDDPVFQTAESFHEFFCNTLSHDAALVAFEQTATHDSRNVLRDCMGGSGEIDLQLPHKPLLFIGAGKDRIIPERLAEKNAKGYSDKTSFTDFKEFTGRSHFICGEPGWEVVAAFIYQWLQQPAVDQPDVSFGQQRSSL